jgi:Major Facilitator Superfamily
MKNNKIQTILLSRFVSSLGDQFMMFALPLIVLNLTKDVGKSGFVFGIEWGSRSVWLLVAGNLLVKFGNSKITLFTEFSKMASAFFAIISFYVGKDFSFPIIILSAILLSCSSAQTLILLEKQIAELSSCREELSKNQARLQSVQQVTLIGGPMLAALFLGLFNHLAVLKITLSIYAISFIFQFFSHRKNSLNTTKENMQNARSSIFKNFIETIQLLQSYPKLKNTMILAFILNVGIGIAMSTNAFVVTNTFGLSESHYSFLAIFSALTSIFLMMNTSYILKKFKLEDVSTVSFLLCAVGLSLMGFAREIVIYIVGYSFLIAFCGVFNVCMRTQRAMVIPAKKLSQNVSVLVFLIQVSLPVSGLLVYLVGKKVDLQNVFLINSCFFVCTLMILHKNIGFTFLRNRFGVKK